MYVTPLICVSSSSMTVSRDAEMALIMSELVRASVSIRFTQLRSTRRPAESRPGRNKTKPVSSNSETASFSMSPRFLNQ